MKHWLVVSMCVLVLMACGTGPDSQVFTVNGKAMEPSFHTGQTVTVTPTDSSSLKRGDVVLISLSEKEMFLKRIIGLPGDTVSIRDGHVYVNDTLQNEPYVSTPATDCLEAQRCGDMRVLDGSVFVLGDNRSNSKDSREFGLVPLSQIKGRVQ